MSDFKLSMWNIFHALPKENKKISMIKEGEATITCARWIVTSYLNPDTVFVGLASEFFGKKSTASILVHRHDIILIEDMEPDELFNIVGNIIDVFQKWNQKLQSILDDPQGGLQKMIDCSEEVFGHPAFIYAPDGSALAISKEYSGSIHWHWNEILQNRGLTRSRMKNLQETIRLSVVFLDTYPTIRDSKMGNHQYMHCTIRANDYMAGHLVLFSMNQPFREGLDIIVDNFVKWACCYVTRHYEQYSPTSWLAQYVRLLINDRRYDTAEMQKLMSTLSWEPTDFYQIYLFQEMVDDEPVLLSKVYLYLTETLKSTLIYQHEKNLILIVNISKPDSGRIEELLNQILDEGFECGISMPFRLLTNCPQYYAQAQEELFRAMENKKAFSAAEDNALEHYRKVISSDELRMTYISPMLKLLWHYDMENHTQYYQTMKAYCYCGFQIADTARKLAIHRNTLNYRLERIRELIDFSLFDRLRDTHDENEMNQLFISFMLIDLHNRM